MKRFFAILSVLLSACESTAPTAPMNLLASRSAARSQPCTSVCYVNATLGNDLNNGDSPAAAKKTIQAALNQVSSAGQVRVFPGTYSETAPGSVVSTLGGSYQFGLFFTASKPGITLLGVSSADKPVRNVRDVQVTINTNATKNFGYDGIFVDADNTTIQGVRIGPNDAGDNKTIEVIADNFTLQFSETAIPDGGGSIYIDDFTVNGLRVKSYHILSNNFPDGTSIDIASGAGLNGPVKGREIIGNTFDLGGGYWNAISFNGSGSDVPWFTYSVGGAIIRSNSFSGGLTQYIRARATYDNSQFDWKGYFNENKFDRQAVVLVDRPSFDVRAYSYSGAYNFTNVRRIGVSAASEASHALPGDVILTKP
jgi:hypothetical protein